jgi:hypothetical protein
MDLRSSAAGVRVAVLAALLSGDSRQVAERVGIYRSAAELAPQLCARGPHDALADIAHNALVDLGRRDADAGLRDASRAFLDELSSDLCLVELVRSVERFGLVPDGAGELLEVAGAASFPAVARLFGGAVDTLARDDVAIVLRRLGDETWRQAFVDAEQRGAEDVVALVPLIRALPAERAWAVGAQLVRSRYAEVRRYASLSLLELREPPELWRRFVAEALTSSDRRIANAARAAASAPPRPPAASEARREDAPSGPVGETT